MVEHHREVLGMVGAIVHVRVDVIVVSKAAPTCDASSDGFHRPMLEGFHESAACDVSTIAPLYIFVVCSEGCTCGLIGGSVQDTAYLWAPQSERGSFVGFGCTYRGSSALLEHQHELAPADFDSVGVGLNRLQV